MYFFILKAEVSLQMAKFPGNEIPKLPTFSRHGVRPPDLSPLLYPAIPSNSSSKAPFLPAFYLSSQCQLFLFYFPHHMPQKTHQKSRPQIIASCAFLMNTSLFKTKGRIGSPFFSSCLPLQIWVKPREIHFSCIYKVLKWWLFQDLAPLNNVEVSSWIMSKVPSSPP